MGLAHLLYSCLSCFSFHLSLESQFGSCTDHSNPPSTMQDCIIYYLFILFSFYQYWWIHDLTVLDLVPKTYLFLFVPSTTTASAWLEYSVLSRVMTSSVTPVFLTSLQSALSKIYLGAPENISISYIESKYFSFVYTIAIYICIYPIYVVYSYFLYNIL